MVSGVAIAGRERHSKTRAPSLTGRASLNALAALLDYAAKLAVGFVVTPIVVAGLGRSLYGAWEMLNRLVTYMSAADGRPTEALRLIIANRRDGADAEQRRAVGAALMVWVIFLPVVAVLGAVFIWFAPAITHVPPALNGIVRITTGLLIVTLIVTLLAEVPESALHGMNIGYRQLGLQASLNVVGGLLTVAAVRGGSLLLMSLLAGLSVMGGLLTVAAMRDGLGLIGLAATQIVLAVVAGGMFLALARRHIPWFGVARPSRGDVKVVLSMSAWLTAGDMVTKVLLASDVLILGMLVAPAVVTSYVLTGYAARTAMGIHVLVASAAMPGVGGLIGRGELARVALLRRELQTLTWLFVTAVGATILVWNHAFLGLWVGEQNYGGGWVDVLIVLLGVQTAFIRSDAYIIDAALQPRPRVIASGAAAIVSIGLAIPLTIAFGTIGLCLGLLAGRTVQSIVYPRLVRSFLVEDAAPRAGRHVVRLFTVLAVILASAALLGRAITVPSWPLWIGGVVITGCLTSVVAFALGLPRADRRAVIERVQALLPAYGSA